MNQKELIEKIVLASERIAKETRHGTASYILASSDIERILNEFKKQERAKKRLEKLKKHDK